MDTKLKSLVTTYELHRDQLPKEVFLEEVQKIIGYGKENYRLYFEKIIASKDQTDLWQEISILHAFEANDEFIDLIHKLFLEPWHHCHDMLLEDLEFRKNPKSIPFIKAAMQKKFPIMERIEGTAAFISNCGHTLRKFGTPEAIAVIKELSESDDPILKDQMLYRLARMAGRDDYERKF